MIKIKGVLSVTVVIIIALISIYIATLLSTTMQMESRIVEMTAKEMKILSVLDQIEAVKIGIKYLLEYSIQQGIYELAKRGGYLDNYYLYLTGRNLEEEEYPLWKNYSRKFFSEYLTLPNPWYPGPPVYEDKILLGISELSKKEVYKYLSNLKNRFEIAVIPSYVGVYSTANSQKSYIFGILGSIEYSSEFFSIKDSIVENINVTHIVSRYIELLEFAKSLFLDNDVINSKINDVFESLKQEGCELPQHLYESVCENEYLYYDPYHKILEFCPDFPKIVEDTFRKKVEELGGVYEKNHLSIVVDRCEISYNYEIGSINSVQDSSCGCKRYQPFNRGESCNGNEREYCISLGYYDGKCNQTTNNIVCYNCLEFDNRIYFSVNLDYDIKIRALINVSTVELYPLYEEKEEKTSLRPITLRFSVNSRY